MQTKIKSIIRIFPDFEEKIDFLFQTNENFRDLCADYILCAGTVQELKNTMSGNSEQINEYEELQLSLQEEILQLITKS